MVQVMARPRIGDLRREQILVAFEACVIRSGLAQTTLADVAAEAGQPRSLVRHFIGNREDMVGALVDRLLERGRSELEVMHEIRTDDAVEDTLGHLLDRLFADATTNAVIMELWYLSLRDAGLRRQLAAMYETVVFEVAEALPASVIQEHRRDRAFATVALAFGAAFFRHLGLQPVAQARLAAASRALLAADRPGPKPYHASTGA